MKRTFTPVTGLSLPRTRRSLVLRVLLAGSFAGLMLLFTGTLSPAGAQIAPTTVPEAPIVAPAAPTPPSVPTVGGPKDTSGDDSTININLNQGEKPSKSIVIILMLTVLSIAPSLLIMVTPFTRIVVVFSLARNALGIPSVPPNQVLTGLALFVALFIMTPTLREMNDVGLQPLLNDKITEQEAFDAAQVPLKRFMLANTRKEDLKIFIDASPEAKPAKPEDVEMTTLIPAYILSELQSAFIIGFVIFVPFLVLDLVVSAVLMSLGMMMLPPVAVSLPFKILLFVMVGGWSLIVESLLRSFH